MVRRLTFSCENSALKNFGILDGSDDTAAGYCAVAALVWEVMQESRIVEIEWFMVGEGR